MPLATPPLISLLTDFGTRDPWVAICKGVILTIAPDVRLVDITHEVAAYDIREGALTLAAAVPELPVGVHMAVVDPGVGRERRGVGVRTRRGDVLVGPDNGLLLPAADALGGVEAAHELREERYLRASGAATFHGRDVFAPAAAHLALGVVLEAFGPRLGASRLVRLPLPQPRHAPGVLQAPVLAVDVFGNVALAANRSELEQVVGAVSAGDGLLLEWWAPGDEIERREVPWAATFGDVEPFDVLLHESSLGRLEIAVNQGHASDELGIGPQTLVNVRRP
jgi:S-adenosylmethionine hydrolase